MDYDYFTSTSVASFFSIFFSSYFEERLVDIIPVDISSRASVSLISKCERIRKRLTIKN